jgi:hypothetical protein
MRPWAAATAANKLASVRRCSDKEVKAAGRGVAALLKNAGRRSSKPTDVEKTSYRQELRPPTTSRLLVGKPYRMEELPNSTRKA